MDSTSAQSKGGVMREVFQTHYNILCRLRLEILASHLVAAEIINTDDHESIRAATNTSDKSAIILRAISSHLDVDYTDSFTLLLDLMYQYGDVVMKKLAGEINQKLNSTSPGLQRRQEIDFTEHSVDEAFSVLTTRIFEILVAHNIGFELLRRACFENVNTIFGANLPDSLVDKIKATDNLSKLFDVLASSSYWNWINIRILKKMVGVSRVEEAKKLIDKYQGAVFSRKLSTLLEQIPKLEIPADYYSQIKQKWKKSLDEVTVQDLVTHWSKMEKMFDVKEPTLLLKNVVDGCVEVYWLIPTVLLHHICCAAFNTRHMNESVLYLKIDSHVIVCNEEVEDDNYYGIAKRGEQWTQSSLVQRLSTGQTIGPSVVKQFFNYLVDVVIQLLQSNNLEQSLHQCKSLMASDVQRISLFSDVQLKELGKYSDNSSLLQNLQFLWTWSDRSVLEALACPSDDAVKLLQQFDGSLDLSQLISAYPILTALPDAVPDDDSAYTVLAVTCDPLLYQYTLQYVIDVRALLMKMCDITAHSLQLLAARADPAVLYWTIPKCVVSLIITKVLEYHKVFHDEMISEVSVYPTIRIATSSGSVLGPLLYLLPRAPTTETTSPEALERVKLINKWLSKPKELSAVFDNLVSDMKSKDENIFQLRRDYHQMSKLFQHVVQQNAQLQNDVMVHKKGTSEYKELYDKKSKDYNEAMSKNEELRKKLEQLPVSKSTDEIEEAVKKLHCAWQDFTSCFQETPSSHMKETGGVKDDEDLTSAKLRTISMEIVETKGWAIKMMKQKDELEALKEKSLESDTTVKQLEANVEKLSARLKAEELEKEKKELDWATQKAELEKALKAKSSESENRNIQIKQLEAEVDELRNASSSKVEELKKEKRQLVQKVVDLRSDAKKSEKIHFGTGRYGDTYKMNHKGIWCTAKILHKTLLKHSQSNKELVAKVIEHCSTLHHSNLVTFIGVTEVDDQPTIMTELMDINLFTFIEQGDKLTLDTQVSLCKDMSQGLQELHKRSLLHKNLHSRNVLIQENRAKLSDYYYPLLQAKGYIPDFTDMSPFVAPEATEDQSKFSTSSDVFSLAVLFLKVITGRTVVQVHKPDVLASSQRHILSPLIQQCLSETPDSRPSAAKICEAIKTAQDSPQYISYKALEKTDSEPLFQAVKSGSKQLEWRTCATLPAPLVGTNAVVLGDVIYVCGGESSDEYACRYVFKYHFLENRWDRLRPLPHSHGVPVVIADKLVIIGGKDVKSKKITNQVSTYNDKEQIWESKYPNLGKERFNPLAITYKHYVIVGGGKYHTIYDRLYDDIEIMDTQEAVLVWKKVPTRLPMKMWSPSATISNDQLWIVGFNNDNSGSLNLIEQRSDEVFWIPVGDVVATDKKGKWEPLPRYMPYYSAIVVPNSYPLVTVGGDTRDTRTTNAIEMHISTDHSWEQIASLDGPSRAYVTVACIGEQQAVVVMGGCTETKSKKTRVDSSLALVQIGYAV